MGRAEVSPLVFFHPCTLPLICGTISKILTLRVKREFCVLVVRLWKAAGSTRQTFCARLTKGKQ